MPNIFEMVNTALGAISPAVPFGQDVFLTTGALPDTYLVWTLISGVGEEHADNAEISRTYRVQVSIMKKTGLVSLPDADTAMVAAGFTKGPERQLHKDSTTSHYGLAKDYFYLM